MSNLFGGEDTAAVFSRSHKSSEVKLRQSSGLFDKYAKEFPSGKGRGGGFVGRQMEAFPIVRILQILNIHSL